MNLNTPSVIILQIYQYVIGYLLRYVSNVREKHTLSTEEKFKITGPTTSPAMTALWVGTVSKAK
jgi:hypothetical protein